MNRFISTLMLGAAAVSAFAAAPQPARVHAGMQPTEPQRLAPRTTVKMNEPADGDLKADFSRRGTADETTFWEECFENGLDGWTVEPTKEVTWQLKNAPTPFSSIREGDTQSLYTDVPYQVFKREISWVTSPEISIPDNAMLRCWLYFSLNWKDVCALEIHISTDDFATSECLYTSLDEEGEKPSQWRHVGVSLASYAGKKAKIRFKYTYGTDDEIFKTGGYQGDFYIDGIEITGAVPVTKIEAMTGEKIDFIDLSEGNPVSWQWSFPGATPSTSTEQNPTVYYTRDGDYDVSLTVTDAEGHTASLTKPGLVSVTGTAPVAHILPPATFRYATTHKPMVAPMATVTFRDASEGYPDSWQWSIAGVQPDNTAMLTADTESVDVNYYFQHDWGADLTVSNLHGTSSDRVEVSAEYSGSVNNLLPGDNLTTFDLEGSGTFPGSNSMGITRYAEKFSAPSVPAFIDGVTVFFTKNYTEELVDQIASVGVHLYTSENGLPGEKIESWWWDVFELDISQTPGMVQGTAFPFTTAPVVSDEFFIVVDGIPDTRWNADVAFAMAGFRGSDGTAYMEKDGKWIEVSSYFPAGHNHTSYAIYPSIRHSVIAPLPMGAKAEVQADWKAGTYDFEYFSINGRKSAESDADWCRVVGEPNGMTVDTLKIEVDEKPNSIPERTATISVTDGATTMPVIVRQSGSNAIEGISDDTLRLAATAEQLTVTLPEEGRITVADISGRVLMERRLGAGTSELGLRHLPAGVYLVKARTASAARSLKLRK